MQQGRTSMKAERIHDVMFFTPKSYTLRSIMKRISRVRVFWWSDLVSTFDEHMYTETLHNKWCCFHFLAQSAELRTALAILCLPGLATHISNGTITEIQQIQERIKNEPSDTHANRLRTM